MSEQLTIRREKGKVWSHIRKKWVVETPEETVRQEYLCEFADVIDAVFRMGDIERALTDEVKPLFETPPSDDEVKPLIVA